MGISKAKVSNYHCLDLKKELEQLQKEYNKSYLKAYNIAYKDYQEEIEPLLKSYEIEVENARKKYCSTHYNPSVPFNPKDPCQNPEYVPYPNIPTFEFEFEKEIDPEKLEEKLSYQSYVTLLDVLGYEFPPEEENSNINYKLIQQPYEIISHYDSYDSIFTQIDNSISINNEVIINNTTVLNPEVSIGGVRVPIVPYTISLQDNMFALYPARTALTSIYTLKMNVPLQWDVIKVVVKREYNSGEPETDTIYSPASNREENILVLPGFYTYTFRNSSFTNAPVYEFEIHFSNGCRKRIPAISSTSFLNHAVTGRLEGEDCPPNSTIKQAPFAPSGFGFKQIGVAEYLRLEQSIHCYLEGEVSHIENIMAREYREKSTRRLIRSEETTTTASETEREQLTDTTTADRFEMQSEVDKVIQQASDRAFSVNSGYNKNNFYLNANASFASSTSIEDSTHQAVTTAKEITERTLDRVIKRVSEERIRKITEEFEENNKHGFDNRKGDNHVVGVYRRVDKLYKNQIYNYGKRMMFEFMIPNPAKLHELGMKVNSVSSKTLIPPIDPRTSTELRMDNYKALNETNAAYWAGIYNAEIKPFPEKYISVGKSLSGDFTGASNNIEYFSSKDDISIPEGYQAISASVTINAVDNGHNADGKGVIVNVGNEKFDDTTKIALVHKKIPNIGFNSISNFKDSVPFSATFANYFSGSVTASVRCELTLEAENQWKQETFKAILDAYHEALDEYKRQSAEEDAKAVTIKDTNPGFYREIENIILRKNCISYLIDQNPNAKYTYGKNFSNSEEYFGDYEIKVNKDLDDYASFVKFIEQAFEWNIISYSFYPFYWGPRNEWQTKYQFDVSNDPTFRAFMQAGLARVIVTVTPGFEEAVQLYLTTGKIWNGGQVPVVGDKLYRDLIADVKKPTGETVGKAWLTRVPTSLTILQADTIGLKVERALPCNCDENPNDYEEGTVLPPCNSNFEKTDSKLNGGNIGSAILKGSINGIENVENTNIKILLKLLDGNVQDIAFTFGTVNWEINHIPAGKYELIIDAENKLPDNEYSVIEGFKQLTVELVDDQVKVVNLKVLKI